MSASRRHGDVLGGEELPGDPDDLLRALLVDEQPRAWDRHKAAAVGQLPGHRPRLLDDLAESYTHILLAALMEMGLLIAQASDPESAHERAVRSIERLLEDLWAHRA